MTTTDFIHKAKDKDVNTVYGDFFLKTYVINLSKVVQKSQNRAGEPTGFAEKLRKTKLHTIRSNYRMWRERFDEIEAGKACISVRQWTGAPYRSKQVEIARFTKDDGIGLEKLFIRKGLIGECELIANVDGLLVDCATLAANDGLSYDDWCDWFDNDKMLTFPNNPHPLPIIHFTKFKYGE